MRLRCLRSNSCPRTIRHASKPDEGERDVNENPSQSQPRGSYCLYILEAIAEIKCEIVESCIRSNTKKHSNNVLPSFKGLFLDARSHSLKKFLKIGSIMKKDNMKKLFIKLQPFSVVLLDFYVIKKQY